MLLELEKLFKSNIDNFFHAIQSRGKFAVSYIRIFINEKIITKVKFRTHYKNGAIAEKPYE